MRVKYLAQEHNAVPLLGLKPGPFDHALTIVQFQKISIPVPWKVNGNSEGVGGLKSQNFKRNVWGLTGISRGVGGFKPKNLPWEGYGYFLEQHIRPDCASHFVELNNFFNLSLFDILPQFFTKVEVNSGGYLPSRESVR